MSREWKGRAVRIRLLTMTDVGSWEMNDTSRSFLYDALVGFNASSSPLSCGVLADISLSHLLRPLVCLRVSDTPSILVVGVVGLGKEGTDR